MSRPARRPTPTERLVERLRSAGYAIPPDAAVFRTHAGYWQRAAGAWSWTLDYERWPRDARGYTRAHPVESPWDSTWRSLSLGSQWPVTVLLRCRHEWQIDKPYEFSSPDRSIAPCEPCGRDLARLLPGGR